MTTTLRKIYLESAQDDKFNATSTQLVKQVEVAVKSLKQISDFAIADILQLGLSKAVSEIKQTQKQTLTQKLLTKNIKYDATQVKNTLKTIKIIKDAYTAFLTTFKQEFSKLEEFSKLQSNDENISLQEMFRTNNVNPKILNDLCSKLVNVFTKGIERSSYFDIRTLTKEDLQTVTVVEIENVNDILNEIDLTKFNEVLTKITQELETSTKQKLDKKTNITDKELGIGARKVALLWQSTKDPNAFVSILISAGLDLEKLKKINIQ